MHWVFAAMQQCAVFSLQLLLLLQSMGSKDVGSVVIAHRLSYLKACGNLPEAGIEPVSPALVGGFSTTGPPGKLWGCFCLMDVLICISDTIWERSHRSFSVWVTSLSMIISGSIHGAAKVITSLFLMAMWKPDVLQSMGSQSWTRLSDWTELNGQITPPVLFFFFAAWLVGS